MKSLPKKVKTELAKLVDYYVEGLITLDEWGRLLKDLKYRYRCDIIEGRKE